MAAVLPESMDKLDPQDTSGSLRTMEQYIRYMAERIDFAVRGMNRNISSAGVSSLVLYNALVELSGSLSSMRGTLNQLSGSVTETQEQVAEMVGLEPATISRIERGVKGLSIDSLLVLSEVYEISTDYILKGDKTTTPSDALLNELSALVQKYKSI